eukprot:1560337-Pyramimonas_sp.AAC.1
MMIPFGLRLRMLFFNDSGCLAMRVRVFSGARGRDWEGALRGEARMRYAACDSRDSSIIQAIEGDITPH